MAEQSARPRAKCLCIDIETARQDRTALREVGVFRPDTGARANISGKVPDLVSRLDALTADAAFVLGHNVTAFDQPALAALHPGLALHRLPLAYALAWLRVAGQNSVLPPWVGQAFPRTREVIARLRDIPCSDPGCHWCKEQHDLLQLLPRYFPGITQFRAEPRAPDGKPLQQAIVENGFAGKSSLAILPTGGGKSLCYQLPALARYYRNGSLTVIVSPLQSLMKDQVDNLASRGIDCAGYVNGLLNPLERRAMLDKLRLGDLGLIFVAPEQFRSVAFASALMQREIAAWVFDEAHCLSKWGHDFRPDYLYVSRFIKARQKERMQVASLDEARPILESKLGPGADIEPYLQILALLMQAADDEGLSTDELILATGRESRQVQAMLRDLDRMHLLSNDIEIGVTLYRDPESPERLEALRQLENALVAQLREAAPDADRDDWQILNVRRLCDTLRRDAKVDLDPEKLSRLLKSFAESFGGKGGEGGQRGFFALRPAGADNRHIKLLRNWQDIDNIRRRRMQLAQVLMQLFLARRQGNNLLVTCKQGELEAALQSDLTLQGMEIRDWNVALAAALIYLDTNEVLHLARGKAVFRTAMRIQLNAEARRRQFKKSDYTELALHYKDKIIQVHVMAEYARLAVGKIQEAMGLIVDYFSLERNAFVQRYFSGRKDVLEMATTEAAHRKILTELQNPEQQVIVAAPTEGSHLVLAGPGSGKTRVIVHRVAWLLRECMALPEEIMVLAYNRAAAVEIRRRLWALVGPDAAGVSVQTLHGLALRLTGTSYAVAAERGEKIRFDAVIRQAAERLNAAEGGDLGSDAGGPSVQRDRLLAGLRYLLVDEYQDINAEHYALISALAGRMLGSEDDKLSLLAVGDDDQNIYAFGGANARFIRQFETDYQARRYHLVENYRSTANIIACANRVIAPARERMKSDQNLRINHVRRALPAGGEFETRDPLVCGRVHILEVSSHGFSEVETALAEFIRLNRLEANGQPWSRFAVIARRWEHLGPMAALCRLNGIPARLMRDDQGPSLHATREGQQLLALLQGRFRKAGRKRLLLRPGVLPRWFRRRYQAEPEALIEHPSRAALAQFIIECESAAPGAERVAGDLVEALYEFGAGGRSASDAANGPMLLLTAHRAKGLEFDHVLILDGGGWQEAGDDERRLFYVAMTRARKTLTLCERQGGRHAFTRDCHPLCLRTRSAPPKPDPRLAYRVWVADQEQIILSWPGYFAPNAPIHGALAQLDYRSDLNLRPRSDGKPGWEVADGQGVTVTRMAQRFAPPAGEIVAVRVAAVIVRHAKQSDGENLRVPQWELVLPEIVYLPEGD